jgi:hypothetical protein
MSIPDVPGLAAVVAIATVFMMDVATAAFSAVT